MPKENSDPPLFSRRVPIGLSIFGKPCSSCGRRLSSAVVLRIILRILRVVLGILRIILAVILAVLAVVLRILAIFAIIVCHW